MDGATNCERHAKEAKANALLYGSVSFQTAPRDNTRFADQFLSYLFTDLRDIAQSTGPVKISPLVPDLRVCAKVLADG